MLYKTHLLFGVLVALSVFQVFNIENKLLFLCVLCIATLFPDLDISRGWLGKRTRPFSWIIKLFFGHRGFLHTVYPAFFLFFLFSWFGQKIIGIAILLGYLTHLFADCLSSEGVKLFHPLLSMRIRGIIRVGGFMERIIIFGLLFLITILLI